MAHGTALSKAPSGGREDTWLVIAGEMRETISGADELPGIAENKLDTFDCHVCLWWCYVKCLNDRSKKRKRWKERRWRIKKRNEITIIMTMRKQIIMTTKRKKKNRMVWKDCPHRLWHCMPYMKQSWWPPVWCPSCVNNDEHWPLCHTGSMLWLCLRKTPGRSRTESKF